MLPLMSQVESKVYSKLKMVEHQDEDILLVLMEVAISHQDIQVINPQAHLLLEIKEAKLTEKEPLEKLQQDQDLPLFLQVMLQRQKG